MAQYTAVLKTSGERIHVEGEDDFLDSYVKFLDDLAKSKVSMEQVVGMHCFYETPADESTPVKVMIDFREVAAWIKEDAGRP